MSTETRILVVEDDVLSRMALIIELKDQGYLHLFEAKNYEQAVKVMDRQDIDVILMDVTLRNSIDGITIARKLTMKYGRKLIIYITGNTDKGTLEEMLSTRPYAIIEKPIDYPHLWNTLLAGINNLDLIKNETQDADKILSLVYETAKIGMCVTDQNGKFVRINSAYADLYGYDKDFMLGKSFTLVLPEDKREEGQILHDNFIYHDTSELPTEWKVLTAKGEIKDIAITAGRFNSRDGQIFKVTTVTDITERKKQFQDLKKALREREILEKETYHRVKNNLNMLASMLSMQIRFQDNRELAGSILNPGIGRIKSLAILHEKLYNKEDLHDVDIPNYIQTLCDQIFLGQDINVMYEMDHLSADIDTAISMGLIVNELSTNIIKHAFKTGDTQNPSAKIELQKKEDKTVKIGIADNGIKLSENFSLNSTNTLGLQMVHALTQQVDGQFTSSNENGFKKFEVEFNIVESRFTW